MVGQTVGKYRVEDRIGRGGMGTVYRAVDETLHRDVAIKVLNSELNDPEVAKRFRAEAITVARLSHPGIATIYELFEHDGQWLMVMEFVKGETLERLVERAGPLTAERAAELVMQALGALTHAHSLGVVHRDLKPANLMLTESGAVKIMDFGIARVSGSEHLTNAGFMMGTPAYMAPEQVLGQEVDARADLYAIGVVLYRVTTGRLPFKGVTPFALAQSQVNDPPTPIRTARQGLPEWLEQVIAVALAKSPGDRFQSAQEFQTTLQRCLSGLPMVMPLDATAPTGMMLTPTGLPTGALAPQTPMGVRMPTGSTATSASAGQTASGMASAASGGQPVLSEMPTQLNSTAGLAAASGARPLPTGGAASTGAQSAAKVSSKKSKGSSTTAVWVGAAAVVLIGIAAAVMWSRRQAPAPPAPAENATPPAAAPASATPADSSSTSPAATPPTPPAADQPATAPPDAAASAPPPAPLKTSPAPASTDAGRASGTPSTTPGRAGPPPATGSATPGKPDATGATAPGARGASAPAATPSRTGGAPATPATPATSGTSAAAAAVPPPTDDAFITFKDVKFMAVKGQDSQDQDALINFGGGQITVVPKDGGTAYSTWPYTSVAHATYAHTKDPKWDATLPGPPENLTIHGFMRGARNWLVLQSKTAYVLLRLDDANWRSVVNAIESRCGVKVDRQTEGGFEPRP
jgi:serine/threonine protein kinase